MIKQNHNLSRSTMYKASFITALCTCFFSFCKTYFSLFQAQALFWLL